MDFWQWLLIVFASVITLVLIVFLYAPLRRIYYEKNLVKIYYKNVKKIAYYKDFYLINQLILNVDDNQQIHIDHLLFADKYIYVIFDRFYPGKLSGKPEDESLLFAFGHGRKQRLPVVVDNPLKQNRTRIAKLSLLTGLDLDLFISVVLVNDDGDFLDIKNEKKMDYIVQRKYFYKLIDNIEKRPLSPINPRQLQEAVQSIARLNQRDLLKKK